LNSRIDIVLPNAVEQEYPAELTARYELLECFCDKGDSRTLLARERAGDALVVVKCFLRESPLYDRSEPQPLRALDAPPMPRFIAEYRGEAMRCVLREYVPGRTLAEEADRARERAIDTGIQLCDQLAALHGNVPPVIHRDIKPRNVVVRPDGQAVLIDFGISRVASGTENDSRTSAAGSDTLVFGTQGFAPPEQYQTHGQGPYTDVYSLCATMYYCLTGKLPPQPMDRLTGTPFPLPSELGVAIDPVIEQAIMDGMELYVQKRIQDTDELWQRLYAAASAPVQTPSNPSVAEPEPIARTLPSEQYVLPMGTIKPLPIELALNSGLNRIRSLCAQIYRKVKESYGDDI